MEDKQPQRGFKYWFVNVFKYHYGKLAIFLLIAAALFIFTVVDTVRNRVDYDFSMVVALNGVVAHSGMENLESLVAETAGDINGNGRVDIKLTLLDMSADGENSQQQLALLMALPENALFIMDEQYSRTYAAKGDFNDLRGYGFEPDEDFPARIYIGDSGAMQKLNINVDFYACLADWTTDGKGKKEWTDAALRIIHAVMES